MDDIETTAPVDWTDSGTSGDKISSGNKSPVIREINESAGHLRNRAKFLQQDSADLHQRTAFEEWRDRTTVRAKSSVQELLSDLSDLGFAWRDVARMVDVSVPAIRKWRSGEKATGVNRHRLAALVAACDQVTEDYEVSEVASWFETPVLYKVPVTPIDLWSAEHPDLVLEHASGHCDPEDVLTAFDPEWRKRYESNFESFVASDGRRSLRKK